MRSLSRLVVGSSLAQDISDPEWPALVQLAMQEKLGPLLAWRLDQAGLTAWREERFPVLTAAMGRAATSWLIMESVRETVQQILDGAQIPVLWLKGIALAHSVYPQPSLRPMRDVDALVPPARYRDALRLIEKANGQKSALPARFASHHAVLMLGPEQRIKLELHRSLLAAPTSRLSGDADWFLEGRVCIPTPRGPLRTLKPETHLVYLAAHAILQHGEADFRLLRFLDLHQLITQTPQFDWDIVLSDCEALGWTYAVERALSINQGLFATPLPQGLTAELQARRRSDEFVSIAVRKRQPGNRWEVTANHLAAMGWPARMRAAMELALPPPSYMRLRYQLRHGWQVPFYYPYRWLDMAGEVVKTLRRRNGRAAPGQTGRSPGNP